MSIDTPSRSALRRALATFSARPGECDLS